MASGISVFCANLLLEKLLRGTAGTFPTPNLYVALYATGSVGIQPTTEVTTAQLASYARQPMPLATAWATLATANNGTTNNLAAITYTPPVSGTGVTVAQFAICDSASGGQILLWGDLTTPQAVAATNPYSFAAGALVIGMQ